MLVDDVELDAVTPADATRATLRYAHSSCASTGRDGVSRDALVVTLLPPGQGQGPGGGDGRGWTEPRAHESGDAVQGVTPGGSRAWGASRAGSETRATSSIGTDEKWSDDDVMRVLIIIISY